MLVHSTSSGLSHGIHMGIGFREKQGAGISIAVHVPGIQMDALPKLTQGMMWNSVLSRVGHTGTSNGRGMDPTLSGGIGRSGTQVRGAHTLAAYDGGIMTAVMSKTAQRTIPYALMALPQDAYSASHYTRWSDTLILSMMRTICQARSALTGAGGPSESEPFDA